MAAGRRASVRENDAASINWRDERASCCGRHMADAMICVLIEGVEGWDEGRQGESVVPPPCTQERLWCDCCAGAIDVQVQRGERCSL